MPGPGGRTTLGGNPRCNTCASLERHRALRAAFVALPPEMLSWRRALQFAPDPSLEEEWFKTFEISEYEGDNSIDVQSIDRSDESYDFLSLSVVLEFVPDDRKAFSELSRIGSDKLFMHMTFGSPLTASETRTFEAPKGPYGRVHDYGADIEEWFDSAGHGLSALVGHIADPVTGDDSYGFGFFLRDREEAETVHRVFNEGLDVKSSLTLKTPD